MKYNWLPDFVYAGIDGSVTTFAVVAGVVGADLSTPVILILGFANLFADGFSMATGKYLSDKAELERMQYLRAIEERSIIEKPKEEKKEIEVILKSFGFRGEDLSRAKKVIFKNPEAWVNLMMNHELNIIEDNVEPAKGAAVTVLAFVTIGLIPLLGYIFQRFLPVDSNYLFAGTCLSTLLALFFVGTVKSRFSKKSWVVAGLETSAVGGFAASIAFFVGYFLQNLAN